MKPAPAWFNTAVAEGLLPPEATLADAPRAQQQRPWPLLLLMAVGAWVVTLLLLLMVFVALGDVSRDPPISYALGGLALVAALGVLRQPTMPMFWEQLALSLLGVGMALLGFGLAHHGDRDLALAVLALMCLLLALYLPRAWLQTLLGAAAAALLAVLTPHPTPLLLLWLLAWGCLQGWGPAWPALRWAAVLSHFAAGWAMVLLLQLCVWAGPSFLLGDAVGDGGVPAVLHACADGRAPGCLAPALSVGAALLGLGLLAWSWTAARSASLLGPALALLVLAGVLPTLGAALLVLCLAALSHSWRQAVAAGVACAWMVGSFYYQLEWPLAHKAQLLVVLGALLALRAWWASRRAGVAATPPATGAQPARWLLGGGLLLVLVVVNAAIWQKQSLIRHGQPVYVHLAPVDPRSLMQGDYMQLNFALPSELAQQRLLQPWGQRLRLAARLNAQGVVTELRLPQGATGLAEGEIWLELTPKDGRWVLVTDAWFFAEGQAQAFEAARFGEFRVLPDGRALLVGMADAELIPIRP
ncbi:GDYXXLXY domain-containing protein [Roseateles sp. BYS180W]|uniref:GDYXXLXY domain-containing protein n=1 Tax=Roseateles rivi TaxID=3299028 RepID=A0ABW7FSW6_9BURK